MARKLAIVALVMLAAATAAVYALWWIRRTAPAPAAGVPIELAQDRAARVSNLKYDVSLRIPAAKSDPIPGRLEASFTLSDPSKALAFDFVQPDDHLRAVVANGQPVPAAVRNGHVMIPAASLRGGANDVVFEFVAGDESLNRSDDFLYSLFVPARASLAMPVFDQPDLKARWQLRLDVPLDWTAVSNGRETGRITTADHLGLIFEGTQPISTYLFAFAAGRFKVETAVRDGRVFHMYHRETDEVKVARNKDAIFDLHARAIAWLEDYTGIRYPFGKFDFVLIPAFQFGGMEHPGAIYYNASGLLLDEAATQNQMLGRANVISHETSHMWFGDLVTMKWFNDVWMKEVFANFMAAKIVNPSFPGVNHDLRFLLQNYPAAYDVDRTEGANPIRQDLANLNDAGSLYGAIIYQKAPIVMRQLELIVSAGQFRDGLREYLSAHAFGNATWPDLIGVLDAKSPDDLKAWSHAWVEEPGRPTITTLLETSAGRIARLAFREADPRGRGLVWPERARILVASGRDVKAFPVTIGGGETEVPGAAGLPAPAWVLPVGDGLGYGLFELDPATLEYLATSLHQIADPLTRGAAHVALWEEMLEGRVAPARVLDELLVALPRERDELNVQDMLGSVRDAFWRYTAADDRPGVAPRIESVLRAGLDRATTTSEKAAWFGALRSVATTPTTVAWLERIWRREVKIPGLPLAESDEADLAAELALRSVEHADEILNAERDRLTNPDRKARFAFIMPALSGDATVRERFFDSLKDVANRRHEAWVLDAARYLHHPLRASVSRKLVVPALDMVWDIQRTGDIFFPKRWADATLSGYQSVQTAADVRAFLQNLPPDYPPRLRWVLLSSADPLFRASRLFSGPVSK